MEKLLNLLLCVNCANSVIIVPVICDSTSQYFGIMYKTADKVQPCSINSLTVCGQLLFKVPHN